MAKRELTAKQQMFVREYLIDLNATQAAIRAGYASKNADKIGYQLIGKTLVRAALMEAQKSRAEKVDLDAQWVLARFKLVSDRCVQGEPVLDKEGNPTGEWRFDAAGANRATEMIGKHLGMFTDKLELAGKDGGPIQTQRQLDLSQITTDQLRELLKKEGQKQGN